MDRIAQFKQLITTEMSVVLATSADGQVTMRLVSPVYYDGGILMFTCAKSTKYRQLKANPHCCIAAGTFFAEATPSFLGATMLPENAELRDAYCAKFPGAFDEGIEFGGRNADFVLLRPTRLTGWAFADDAQAEGAIPSVPFDVSIE